MVPKIRIRIESACFNLFFERNISPTVTGNNAIIKKKSNLNWEDIAWNPSMNFELSISIISEYTESPAETKVITSTITATYDIYIAIFVLLDICDLYVVNRVIMKNGATYALVKTART